MHQASAAKGLPIRPASVMSANLQSPLRSPARFPEIRAGQLSVRLAENQQEVSEAQRLRYRVFCQEMGARPSDEMHRLEQDFDQFDPLCDHLLVLDDSAQPAKVVGTYRLLRKQAMEQTGSFYTESEFDVSCLKDLPGEIMELGRSCVAAEYRNRVVMQLLWRGIAAYVGLYRIVLMFGCGSFPGTDPTRHAVMLSYLYHYHLAPVEMRPKALPQFYEAIDLVPKEQIDARQAFSSLPTLIKGYLRLGGAIGDGAVIDHDYNTTDVAIVVRTAMITDHYAKRYAGSLPEPEDLPF